MVLYDAENIPAKYLAQVVNAVSRMGGRFTIRAFGPPSLMASPPWKEASFRYGVERVLCDGCKAGKNSADIRLAVDAMDLLAADGADTFVIVSCDTDFTPVMRRLRQAGKRVHGIGCASTGQKYRKLYDSFVVLKPCGVQECAVSARKQGKKGAKPAHLDEATVGLLLECAQEMAAPDEWCDVGQLCNHVRKRRSSFSAKQYGCGSVTKLIEKTGRFDVRKTDHGNYVRPRVAWCGEGDLERAAKYAEALAILRDQ